MTLVSYIVSQVLRLGSNLLLWRFLEPEAFGLMALVNVIINGLHMFSDLGIAQSIVQSERGDDPKYLNTVWTIQVCRGIGLCLLSSAAGYPAAYFYKQPDLVWLLPVVAIGSAIGGFNSTKLFTASRHLALGRLTVIDLATQLSTLSVMLPVAYYTRSLWALAIGEAVSTSVRLALSHMILPGTPNRFCWDKDAVKAVSHFGRWIFISTMLTFLASSSDRLVFGKRVPMALLGVYSVGMVWATFPQSFVGKVTTSVVFPLFSRVRNQRGNVAIAYRKVRWPVLLGGAWLAACLLAGGPALVRFLYNEKAYDAGWIIQLLVLGNWFLCIESVNTAALLAVGQPKWIAFGNAAKVVALVVGMPLGALLYGFPGAILGFSLSEVAKYIVSAAGTRRLGLSAIGQDLVATSGLALTAGIAHLAQLAVQRADLRFLDARIHALVEGIVIFVVLSALWFAVFRLHRRASAPPVEQATA